METITLSIPAVDVLGEQLNLNVRQYPFDIPHWGASTEERERMAQQVWAELESHGLASNGRPEPEVEDALYLLSSSEVSIAAAGVLDVRSGHRLSARIVATGEVGVAGVLDPRGLRMWFLQPDELPAVGAELLPDAPPGAGDVAEAPVERPPSRQGPPSVPESDGLRAIEAMTARPKFRIGHYVVTRTGRRGRRARLPSLAWFDNDQGRYSMVGDANLLSCGPASKGDIAEQLAALLGQLQ